MVVETSNLMTVKNFARKFFNKKKKTQGVSEQRVYDLIRKGKITPITIDGVIFIDAVEHNHLTLATPDNESKEYIHS
jgi:hypothetical protein